MRTFALSKRWFLPVTLSLVCGVGASAKESATQEGNSNPPYAQAVENEQSATVIRGVVFDAEGEPLPGASVWEKKSPKTATATNIDGIFSLPAKGRKSVTLVVSYIGMKRKEVT